MIKIYPLLIVYEQIRNKAKRRLAICSRIIALTITLTLLAMPLTVNIGCNPLGDSQARAAEKPKTEQLITPHDLQEYQKIARKFAAAQKSEGKAYTFSLSGMTNDDIEMLEQNAQLANEQSKKAFSLIKDLTKSFAPSLDLEKIGVSPSPNKIPLWKSGRKGDLVKNTRIGFDIIKRASKIAENVSGVGRIDPFAPLANLGDYQRVNQTTKGNFPSSLRSEGTTEPRTISSQDSNLRKSNVIERKSTGIQLKGTAISSQPAAILAINGISHLVSRGDVVAGMKVIEIREDEIVLDKNGKRYDLTLSH